MLLFIESFTIYFQKGSAMNKAISSRQAIQRECVGSIRGPSIWDCGGKTWQWHRSFSDYRRPLLLLHD